MLLRFSSGSSCNGAGEIRRYLGLVVLNPVGLSCFPKMASFSRDKFASSFSLKTMELLSLITEPKNSSDSTLCVIGGNMCSLLCKLFARWEPYYFYSLTTSLNLYSFVALASKEGRLRCFLRAD